MAIRLGAIADDYTGASDLANTLTSNGLRTVQTIGVPQDSFPLPDVDAVVVALKIRSVPAQEAVAAARRADRWLRARGAAHVMYKICSTFDSTDAGNIGPVTEALRADAGGDIVLVTPAFPATGRTVYLGRLFVGTQLLSESPLKDHPLNPMRDANLVAVLGRQSSGAVGLVDLATVAGGAPAIAARLAELEREGKTAVIVDAVSERDLEALGRVAAERAVSTGASGLGLGLARALGAGGPVDRRSLATWEPVGGLAAIVVGSCSAATLEQLEVAERSLPVFRLDPEQLLSGEREIEAALHWAGERIAQGAVVISAAGSPETVVRLQDRYGREASGHAIEAATSTVAARLVEMGVKRLIVAGGETSGAAVDRLGIAAFEVGPEIAPGVPLLRTLGDRDAELLVALKSGNFGGADFFTAALAMMR